MALLDYTKLQMFRKLFGFGKQVEVSNTDLEKLFDPTLGLGYSWYDAQMQFSLDRRRIYQDMEEMDTYGLLSSSLDVYAEEATQYDQEHKATVWVESENQRIKDLGNQLLETLNVEDTVYGTARGLAKYGDLFEHLALSKTHGVVAERYVRPDLLTRIEDDYGRLLGFAPGIIAQPNPDDLPKEMFKPWDFAHFRIMGSRRDSAHGDPLLMAARRDWRQLKIMEDSMLLYRVNRAPDRLKWLIDTGTQDIGQQFQTIAVWKRMFRKRQFFDPKTGSMKQEWNPLAVEDDLFVPKPKGSETSVDKLAGSTNAGDIHDVNHFRNKVFSDTKIPKGSMGYEGEINSKATITSQDVRFARTIKRLQRGLREGYMRKIQIHLVLLSREGKEDLDPLKPENKFEVCMSPINFLEELQRAEFFKMKIDVSKALAELGTELDLPKKNWRKYVLVKHLELTTEEAEEFTRDEGVMEPPEGEEVPAGAENPNEPPAEGEPLTRSDEEGIDAAISQAPKKRLDTVRKIIKTATVASENRPIVLNKTQPVPDKTILETLSDDIIKGDFRAVRRAIDAAAIVEDARRDKERREAKAKEFGVEK